MIDIQAFNKSLKTTLIKQYLDKENQGKWTLFFDLGATPLDTAMAIRVSYTFIEILANW